MKLYSLLIFIFFHGVVFSQETRRSHSRELSNIQASTGERVATVGDSDSNIESLIKNNLLGGECIEVRNISYKSAVLNEQLAQIGKFERSETLNIGFERGIILSSGYVPFAPGPNESEEDANTTFSAPGDPDIENSLDAAFIEFEFKPTGDKISFNYVFASEEYPNFVCQTFNDRFIFAIKKVDSPEEPENIALIPGTQEVVSINTVNDQYQAGQSCPPADYSEYYRTNRVGSPRTSYNGYTTTLTAEKEGLTPCEWYSIKILIADVGDDAFDSTVFLESDSFTDNNKIQISKVGNRSDSEDLNEECGTGYFEFNRPPSSDLSEEILIEFDISGTATPGVDYEPLPESITIPPGESRYRLSVTPILDSESEGDETIILTTTNITCGCTSTPLQSELTITDFEEQVTEIEDSFCETDSYVLPDGRSVNESGVYRSVIPSRTEMGCDSLIVTTLEKLSVPTVADRSISLCPATNLAILSADDLNIPLNPNERFEIYESMEDAQASENVLELPGEVEAGDYVIKKLQGENECAGFGELNIQFYEKPVVDTEEITTCVTEGETIYDLQALRNIILNANNNVDVQFYENESATEPLPDSYQSEGNTIIALATNQTTGCSTSRLIQLTAKPFVNEPTETFLYCIGSDYTLKNGDVVNESGVYSGVYFHEQSGCDRNFTTELVPAETHFPSAFSPNGNQRNEYFKPVQLEDCNIQVENFRLTVFDRWGTVVFQSDEFTEGWDGRIDGQTKQAVYLWTVSYEFEGTSVKRHGAVNLIK